MARCEETIKIWTDDAKQSNRFENLSMAYEKLRFYRKFTPSSKKPLIELRK